MITYVRAWNYAKSTNDPVDSHKVQVILSLRKSAFYPVASPKVQAILSLRKKCEGTCRLAKIAGKLKASVFSAERGDRGAGADGAVLAHAAPGDADVVQRGDAAGAAGAGHRAGRRAVPHVAAGGEHPAPERQRADHLQPHHVHDGDRRLHQSRLHLYI